MSRTLHVVEYVKIASPCGVEEPDALATHQVQGIFSIRRAHAGPEQSFAAGEELGSGWFAHDTNANQIAQGRELGRSWARWVVSLQNCNAGRWDEGPGEEKPDLFGRRPAGFGAIFGAPMPACGIERRSAPGLVLISTEQCVSAGANRRSIGGGGIPGQGTRDMDV